MGIISLTETASVGLSNRLSFGMINSEMQQLLLLHWGEIFHKPRGVNLAKRSSTLCSCLVNGLITVLWYLK